jgi:hypothetical protein
LHYLLFVVIASVFNFTAILFIPFYFILRVKITTKTFPVLTGISVVLFFLSEEIGKFFTKAGFAVQTVLTSEERRFATEKMVIFAVIFLVSVLFKRMLVYRNERNEIFITSVYFAFFFQFLAANAPAMQSSFSVLAISFAFAPTLSLSPQIYNIIKKLTNDTFIEYKLLRRVIYWGAAVVLFVLWCVIIKIR